MVVNMDELPLFFTIPTINTLEPKLGRNPLSAKAHFETFPTSKYYPKHISEVTNESIVCDIVYVVVLASSLQAETVNDDEFRRISSIADAEQPEEQEMRVRLLLAVLAGFVESQNLASEVSDSSAWILDAGRLRSLCNTAKRISDGLFAETGSNAGFVSRINQKVELMII
ncbi:unnamed protein product [Strongylus vulgaris]|uniref:Uncharacterized protein n=1 Tax=Strongylus vulgaris TaxID=40348 RepID=A0A3P7LP30_STRVU|nr:unnamed protein product [Strongylus vulgaris]